MHTHTDQTRQNKATADGFAKKGGTGMPGFSYADNRSEAIQMKGMQALANNSPQVRQLAAVRQTGNGHAPIQLLGAGDYTRAALNANGKTDLQNITDSVASAIRANIGGMDWGGWWAHIRDNNHNAKPKVGNQSSFLDDTQVHIRAYAEQAIAGGTYSLTGGGMMVFESTTGNVCNGSDGRRNVRVTIDVNAARDDQPLSGQLAGMIVTNSYPIP